MSLENLLADKRVKVISNTVRLLLGEDPIHGWPHVLRVLGLSLRIASELEGNSIKIDYEVLILAVLLHDIGRRYEKTLSMHHAIISSRIARKILALLGYNDEIIGKVMEAIEAHSYSLGRKPKSIEAMILSDADKIDAMGAIGIARAFMLSGLKGRSIEDTIWHFHEKLLRLEEALYLEASKIIAKRRKLFLEKFLKELSIDLEESKPCIELIEYIDH